MLRERMQARLGRASGCLVVIALIVLGTGFLFSSVIVIAHVARIGWDYGK